MLDIDRRVRPIFNAAMKLFLPAALALCAILIPALSHAEESPIYTVPLKDIDGKDTNLKPYTGKVLLVVNVASKCGNTPQYKGLEELWRKYKDRGLVVLGFPCNDFGSQEPGTNEEIKTFCSSRYDVTFPMFDKLHVKGPEVHPLYTELSGEKSPFPGPVKWNFGKFLISRDGHILARFEPGVKPETPAVTTAVEKALAEK
jgi:glutathione peroxidase